MTRTSGQWTLGVLVGLPIGLFVWLLFVAGGVVFLLFARRHWNEPKGYIDTWTKRTFGIAWASIMAFLSLIVLAIIGFAMWPWSAEYHQYRPVHGQVATVASRLISNDGNTKYVVTLTTGPQQYGIADTRAALLKPGDQVSLRCIRVYEYGSNNAGYDCKWGQ